ncbi:MAG: 50S ribosomal protein L19 [Minisyncoccia bacterium]|jgi:large subunit ribosomal protein L19
MDQIQTFNTKTTATDPKGSAFSDIRPGVTLKVHQRIKEGAKTRVQVFEGMVIARKHGSGPNATITVRKVSNGIGVERVFPLHLPTIEKFEIAKTSKVRQAKLYYLRTKSARETRRKVKIIEPSVGQRTESEPSSQEAEK